ncbi:MAG: heparan-alpha-glucosaminide N-acetyltransferase domain-containing protein [Fluviicola sp.]
MTTQEIKATPKVRLKFIDMARSVAILLMLEGHFVDDTLLEVYRDDNNMIYSTWLFIRSFTAPVFLTVTGMIFVYLLLKNREERWIDNIRIRKGFKRVVELLFWGLAVQWYAFHVLEAISFGILSILIIYGLYKLIRFVPLWLFFFAGGVTIFALYKIVLHGNSSETFIEQGYMHLITDNIGDGRDPKYWFPIIPSVGYTMFGAMIGALLHDLKNHVRNWYFPATVFTLGFVFFWWAKDILGGLDSLLGMESFKFIGGDSMYSKMGMVLMELSVLIFIDNKWGHRIKQGNLFLKVGQNTLTIYVLHMVLLYGSITGLGLNRLFNKGEHSLYHLNPWQVAIGAALFVVFFIVLIKYLDWIKKQLEFILGPIRRFFNKLFFVS